MKYSDLPKLLGLIFVTMFFEVLPAWGQVVPGSMEFTGMRVRRIARQASSRQYKCIRTTRELLFSGRIFAKRGKRLFYIC
jgi:hypothetical protein